MIPVNIQSGTGTRLAKAGYAVYGIDYEGHGKSAGLECYVKNMDDVIEDCCNHFTSICCKYHNFFSINLSRFWTHQRIPKESDGHFEPVWSKK